jgi:hypothetical protein
MFSVWFDSRLYNGKPAGTWNLSAVRHMTVQETRLLLKPKLLEIGHNLLY